MAVNRGRPSGREVKERREQLKIVVKDGIEFKEGSEILVQSVLSYAGLGDDSKKLVSRAILKDGLSRGYHWKRGQERNKKISFSTYILMLTICCY